MVYISERKLQGMVVETAQLFSWWVHHDRPARTGEGKWRTHIQGDIGFPDLVLARAGVVLYAELKSAKAKLEPWQEYWCQAITGKPVQKSYPLDSNYHIWRPVDWTSGWIEEVLR